MVQVRFIQRQTNMSNCIKIGRCDAHTLLIYNGLTQVTLHCIVFVHAEYLCIFQWPRYCLCINLLFHNAGFLLTAVLCVLGTLYRSPICRLIVAEDLWALLDALQEPVPDEVHQHLETVTLNTPFNTSYPSSPAPPPASRPSQLNISRSSPEPLSTPPIPAVQDSPAMMLNPGTTPIIAEDESGMCFNSLKKGGGEGWLSHCVVQSWG